MSANKKFWQVERSPDYFERVLAHTFDIRDGCLLFYTERSMDSWALTIGFSSDEWITFFPDDD